MDKCTDAYGANMNLFHKPRYNLVAGTARTAVRCEQKLMSAIKILNPVDVLTRNYWVTARDFKSPVDSKLVICLSLFYSIKFSNAKVII
jgi:hypothetical protein